MTDFSLSITSWYRQNKRNLPWRNTSNPYFIWLSEVILQQTRVDQGTNYYNKFIKNYPTIIHLANASEKDILNDWQGLGYYSRGRNLHFTAKFICNELKEKFPNNYKELIKLKGVGDYTASAIASFAFNEKVAPVDSNVIRVITRFFGIEDDVTNMQVLKHIKEIANQLLPEIETSTYNQGMMEFGALQCKPVSPNCKLCPLNFKCWAFLNNKISSLPVKNKKIIKKDRFFSLKKVLDFFSQS